MSWVIKRGDEYLDHYGYGDWTPHQKEAYRYDSRDHAEGALVEMGERVVKLVPAKPYVLWCPAITSYVRDLVVAPPGDWFATTTRDKAMRFDKKTAELAQKAWARLDSENWYLELVKC